MITPESAVEPALIPPLDSSQLTLNETEKMFLHDLISADDDELRERIMDVQKRAYEKYPYPCIRGFHFVNLFMAANSIYPSVVTAGKNGDPLFLDLGCMMGTDVRKLVYDGYPAARILGCDLRPEYIELGYALFRDKETCPIRFFTSNVFDMSPSATTLAAKSRDLSSVTDLSELRGSLTHIYTGALFHLFDKDTQHALALRLALLLKKTPGAVIFGRHQGLEKEGYIDDHLGRNRYGHSAESWPVLWKTVFTEVAGAELAQSVVVQADLTEGFGPGVFNGRTSSRMLYWSTQIM